jgi:hypothetical protein
VACLLARSGRRGRRGGGESGRGRWLVGVGRGQRGGEGGVDCRRLRHVHAVVLEGGRGRHATRRLWRATVGWVRRLRPVSWRAAAEPGPGGGPVGASGRLCSRAERGKHGWRWGAGSAAELSRGRPRDLVRGRCQRRSRVRVRRPTPRARRAGESGGVDGRRGNALMKRPPTDSKHRPSSFVLFRAASAWRGGYSHAFFLSITG